MPGLESRVRNKAVRPLDAPQLAKGESFARALRPPLDLERRQRDPLMTRESMQTRAKALDWLRNFRVPHAVL
jgi:hypothetical protein